jgi:hypothetical protein
MPSVRHSLLNQVVAAYRDRLGQKRPLRPMERLTINIFGATIADDLAAKLMTPENLSVLLKRGTVRNAADNNTFGSMSSLAEVDVPNLFAIAGRSGRRVCVAVCRRERRSMHFVRQLAAVQHYLPARVVAELVGADPLTLALALRLRFDCGF